MSASGGMREHDCSLGALQIFSDGDMISAMRDKILGTLSVHSPLLGQKGHAMSLLP